MGRRRRSSSGAASLLSHRQASGRPSITTHRRPRRAAAGLAAVVLVLGVTLGVAACPRPLDTLGHTLVEIQRACGDNVCESWEQPATCPWDCQRSTPADVAPQYPHASLLVAAGDAPAELHQCMQDVRLPHTVGQIWVCPAADSVIWQITYLGNDEWELHVDNRSNATVTRVNFPWRVTPSCLDKNCSDTRADAAWRNNRVLYGYLGGLISGELPGPYSYGPFCMRYPGESFSPIVVITDDHQAELIAATNWPVQTVKPSHAGFQTMFGYDTPIPPGGQRSYRVMLRRVIGNPAFGYPPWLIAVEQYKRWIDAHVPRPAFPDWIERGEGFLGYGLQNAVSSEDAEPYLRSQYLEQQDVLDALLLWGQMSNYAGPASLAQPPLVPGEATGCCLTPPGSPPSWLHRRYTTDASAACPHCRNWVVDFVRSLPADPRFPWRAGYYARPDGRLASDGITCVAGEPTAAAPDSLTRWLAANASNQATAFYVDVIGRGYMGPPDVAVPAFDRIVPRDAIIEGFIDVFARAPLMSGYVAGIAGWPGGPDVDPAVCPSCTFIRMSRYILGDRPGYLGQANGEHVFGNPDPDPRRAFWIQRQAFLLGLKHDVQVPVPLLREIKQLRDRVRWWERRPRYLDVAGLLNVPAQVSARRFDTSDGATLITVDNPMQVAGLRLVFRGTEYAIAPDNLSIIEARP
jgi:hypothetical protein